MSQVSEQDNKKSVFGMDEVQAFLKSLWAERVTGLSDALFDYVFTQHHTKMVSLITPMVKKSSNELLESLGVAMLDGRADWYVVPTKAVYTTVTKLSKGFKLRAENIAPFFKDDNYIGSDIRSVLLPDEQGRNKSDARVGFSCSHFTRACQPFLPENFFKKDNKDLQDTEEAFLFVERFPWNENTQCETSLTTIHLAQKWKRVMPLVSATLEINKCPNLATIADGFTQRFEGIERRAIAVATREMQMSVIK